MKNAVLLVVLIMSIVFSCNEEVSNEKANEKLVATQKKTKDALATENEVAKAKTKADWNHFKTQSDSSIANMKLRLRKTELNLDKASKSERRKLFMAHEKASKLITVLEEKLNKRNAEFAEDIKAFDNKVSEKNSSFKREFKHDMDEFGSSLKKLFKDNVH